MNAPSIYIPVNLMGNYFAGVLAFAKAEYPDSIKEFELIKKAYTWDSATEPIGRIVYMHLMTCYMAADNVDTALLTAREAVETFPKSLWALKYFQYIQDKKNASQT